MSNLRTLCRPHTLFSFISCRHQFQLRDSFRNLNLKTRFSSPSLYSTWLDSNRTQPWFRVNQRRTVAKASNWVEQKSPYETLELERDAGEDQIKSAYRRLAKFYHPDVYDGRGILEEGESAEARFIKIQAAYELLIDEERRSQYDMDNRVNPMKASQAWMEWIMKKRKAFDQRGDMAVAAWAEQQQQKLNIRVRQLSRSKIDLDEARKILGREKKASAENFSNTLKRHTLILKKRDLIRRNAEEEKKKIISQLLEAEGFRNSTISPYVCVQFPRWFSAICGQFSSFGGGLIDYGVKSYIKLKLKQKLGRPILRIVSLILFNLMFSVIFCFFCFILFGLNC